MAITDEDLNAALDAFEKEGALSRAEQDRHLHSTWINSGKDPEHLAPLLHRYKPFIDSKTRQLSGGALTNQEAVRGQVMNKVIEAFETYDPSRGTALNTHVQNRAQGALRSVIKSQNMARLPESDALQIGKIQRAGAQFEDDYGRPPEDAELARAVGMSATRLKNIRRRAVRDVSSGGTEVPLAQQSASRSIELMPMLRRRLATDHPNSLMEKVFVETYGQHGERMGSPQSTGALARKFGVKDHEVSQAKTNLAKMMKEFE